MKIVIIGLTITSSWGNGHATTYRALVRALARRGHEILFLENDKPWYAENRDLPNPPHCRTRLYRDHLELAAHYRDPVANADVVLVGSYVPDGITVGRWVQRTARGICAFYDIDTPITMAGLHTGSCAYLSPALIGGYEIYFSFTGGPVLDRLERNFGSPRARALYCSVDPEAYSPEQTPTRWDLGYLGTYSSDRQATLERLLSGPAARNPGRRFVVAGSLYPDAIAWPGNVERIKHLPPPSHRGFYNSQRFTLNVTRADMIAAGWSPSVRLFEAAACGTPIISDWWKGLDRLFRPGEEILIARTGGAIDEFLGMDETTRRRIGAAARERVLAEHTSDHRAREFENHIEEARSQPRRGAA